MDGLHSAADKPVRDRVAGERAAREEHRARSVLRVVRGGEADARAVPAGCADADWGFVGSL